MTEIGKGYIVGVVVGLFFGGLMGWAFTAHYCLHHT